LPHEGEVNGGMSFRFEKS